MTPEWAPPLAAAQALLLREAELDAKRLGHELAVTQHWGCAPTCWVWALEAWRARCVRCSAPAVVRVRSWTGPAKAGTALSLACQRPSPA